MSAWPLLRAGDRGAAVRDLRTRLNALGFPVEARGDYDDNLVEAVRAFQRHRRLRVDGICGPETWGALIESGYALGDRLLYFAAEMLRGDDVADLQQRLNALGFDAGREDGILGPATERAIRAFQRNAGVSADGVCGPATLGALHRVGGLSAGSVAEVREREDRRRNPHRLDGLRIFLVGEPELAAVATSLARKLGRNGAIVGLDTSGSDASTLAAEANRFGAGAFVALMTGPEPGMRCSYFAKERFRSESGYCLASRLTEALRTVAKVVHDPAGRTNRLLRETRMGAVVCELAERDDLAAMSWIVAAQAELEDALLDGIRRGIEEPPPTDEAVDV